MKKTAPTGRLRNILLNNLTQPLPYTSRISGQDWSVDDTWTNYPVWDAPNNSNRWITRNRLEYR
jgi:hypothetical protein